MRKKILFITIILAGIVIGYILLFANGNREATNRYQIAQITRGDIINMVSCSGTLEAVGTVEVGTQVSGVLDQIYVDFNDRIQKNQMLALLDTVMLKAQVQDAEANYEKAKAQFEEAKANHERNLKLYEKGLISEADYLPYKIQLEIQKATVMSAKASVIRTKQNLKYAFIRSPIKGTVIQRSVEKGQTVAASLQAPTLFIIAEDLSRMEIHAQVDESDIGQIREGQRALFEVQSYPDKQFEGTVRQIRLQPEVIQNVVNYTVVVDANNDEELLLPGMTATIDFYVQETRDVLLVPNTALRFQPSEEMITEFQQQKQKQFENLPDSVRQQKHGENPKFAGKNEKNTEIQNMNNVWYIDSKGKPEIALLRTGISDGKVTEILKSRGLSEGTQVITGWIDEQNVNKTTNQRLNRRMGPPPLF